MSKDLENQEVVSDDVVTDVEIELDESIVTDEELEAETEAMDSGDFLKGLGALSNGEVYDYSAGKAVAKKSR